MASYLMFLSAVSPKHFQYICEWANPIVLSVVIKGLATERAICAFVSKT